MDRAYRALQDQLAAPFGGNNVAGEAVDRKKSEKGYCVRDCSVCAGPEMYGQVEEILKEKEYHVKVLSSRQRSRV